MRKMIVGTLLLCLVTAGLIRVMAEEKEHETPPINTADANDSMLTAAYTIINEGFVKLKPVFVRGCFDCHSEQTKFPWYHKLPVIGGWMDGHIKTARRHLDMTNGFPFTGGGSQLNMIEDIRHEIEEGEMPIFSYRLMHWSAAPDDAEKDSIYAWVDRSIQLLSSGSASGE